MEGEGEAACGAEYQFVRQMWHRTDAGVPSDFLRVYRKDVAQKYSLAMLRTRKRASEEVDLVEATRHFAHKKVK